MPIIVFSFFLLSPLFSYAQAKCEVKETKKNFGFVKRGELVLAEFEITNTGNQPLIITDVEVACSCTSADFPEQPILPNQQTKITVKFNTKSAYGRQDRSVHIISNDPRSPIKLRIKGIVSSK
jgi:LEA14-like dessication related protein